MIAGVTSYVTWLRCRVDQLLTGKVAPLAGSAHLSGIDKHVLSGRIWCGTEGLTGDEQGDRLFHGGPDKAVHHYPREHYAFWRAQIGHLEWWLRPGAFGENISFHAFTEHEVCIGDRFSIGEALLKVSQARQPHWPLSRILDVLYCRPVEP